MKTASMIAAMLLSGALVGGCAEVSPATRAQFISSVPTCSGEADCKAKWEAAQLWVIHHAGYKIQTTSDVLIETYNPGPYEAADAVRVTKEPMGAGQYKLVVFVWCNNPIGCVPNGWDLALDFNREVGAVVATAVATPSPVAANQVTVGSCTVDQILKMKETGLSEAQIQAACGAPSGKTESAAAPEVRVAASPVTPEKRIESICRTRFPLNKVATCKAVYVTCSNGRNPAGAWGCFAENFPQQTQGMEAPSP